MRCHGPSTFAPTHNPSGLRYIYVNGRSILIQDSQNPASSPRREWDGVPEPRRAGPVNQRTL